MLVALSLGVSVGCTQSESSRLVEVKRAWPVMGTMLTITAWGSDSASVLGAIRRGRAAVTMVDSLMSSYRDDSDVTRISRGAGSAVTVAPETMRVMLMAREYWRISGGRFDPSVGPLMDVWGLSGDSGAVPSAARIDSARSLVGFSRVEMDTVAGTVRLPVRGMRVDLGGIAKGYALDQARLAMKGGTAAGMIDLGGNVLVYGRSPGASGKWRIGVLHPRRDGRLIGTVSIDSGAIATSGNYEKFFVSQGRRYGHIIDVKTGRPAVGVVSASAVGPGGKWSDGLSAAFLLLGPARGLAVADSLRDVSAIVVSDPGNRELQRTDVHLSARARVIFTFDSGMR